VEPDGKIGPSRTRTLDPLIESCSEPRRIPKQSQAHRTKAIRTSWMSSWYGCSGSNLVEKCPPCFVPLTRHPISNPHGQSRKLCARSGHSVALSETTGDAWPLPPASIYNTHHRTARPRQRRRRVLSPLSRLG
jgi:hypothetical protein